MPIHLIADGGKNDKRGPYCSYLVLVGQSLDLSRETIRESEDLMMCVTSNEAEYLALIRGLEAVIAAVPIDPEFCKVVVIMDSKLVIEQVGGAWKVKARNLLPLRDFARELLSKFGEVVLTKEPRDFIEGYLGH